MLNFFDYATLVKTLKDMGLKVDGGINWDWINNIKGKELAEQIHKDLESQGYETRGIYDEKQSGYYAIRFR
jgi:hypothetical protein